MKLSKLITGSISTLVLVMGLSAQANDGALPYINVTGVDPAGNADGTTVTVYGNETQKLFEVLPIDFVYPEMSRSIQFRSRNYEAGIYCSRDYIRPTTGEERSDHHCTFGIYKRAQGELESDEYNVFEENGYMMLPVQSVIPVLGIDPGKLKFEDNRSVLFSFYGDQAEYMGKTLDGMPIVLYSRAYTVQLICQKEYQHPFRKDRSGQPLVFDDYKCDVIVFN